MLFEALTRFLSEGWLTTLAAVILMLEGVILFLALPRSGKTAGLWFNLGSGLCLVGALHAALVGWGTVAILTFLSLALIAHLGDLIGRLSDVDRKVSRRSPTD